MNHEAIYATHPQVVSVDDTAGAFDKDGNKVVLNEAAVNAWVDPNAYKRLRAQAYPDYRDYLDGIVKGDAAQVQKYVDDCMAVKARFPK